MSCTAHPPKWIKIPDVGTHCVKETANYGLEHYNKECKGSWTLVNIIAGWYWEKDACDTDHRLYLKVKDPKGVVITIEIIIRQTKKDGKIVNTIISIIVGILDTVTWIFWRKIPNIAAACVTDVAKFALGEIIKITNEKYEFICTVEGYYRETDIYIVEFWLTIKVKDCLGREIRFEVWVKEVKKPRTKRIWTLIKHKQLDHACPA